MTLPSLPALRAFDVSARLGSFKAAAEELNVSPTAISHHIRSLEEQLQISLFVRGTRQVSLTEAGRTLAEATSLSFSRIEVALEALRESERVLTISATPAFAALWLASRLSDFEARHPEINVQVLSSTEKVDLQRDRAIDLAIRYGEEAGVSPDAQILAKDRIAAFGAPDYLGGLAEFSEAKLISTKWVSDNLPPIGWSYWRQAAGEDAPETARARAREFNQEQDVMQAGLAGKGLVLLSELLAQDMVKQGWLRHYRQEVRLDGYVYWAETNPLRKESKKIQKFLHWLVEMTKEDKVSGTFVTTTKAHPS